MNEKALKYNILKWHNTKIRKQVTKALSISDKTYYTKINAVCGEKQGFEYCEILIIAKILERNPLDLISLEAINYYQKNKTLGI